MKLTTIAVALAYSSMALAATTFKRALTKEELKAQAYDQPDSYSVAGSDSAGHVVACGLCYTNWCSITGASDVCVTLQTNISTRTNILSRSAATAAFA